MGNYYQEKKSYNKYKPNSSYDDLDCYGGNYFNNNNNNNNNNTNSYNNFNNKPQNARYNYNRSNLNSYSQKSNDNGFASMIGNFIKSNSQSGNGKKTSPLVFFILPYMLVLIFSLIIETTIGSNIIEGGGRIFSKAFLYSLFELPIVFFLWKIFIEKVADEALDEGEKIFAAIATFTLIPAIFITINMGIIEYYNSRLDRSKPIKRYLLVTQKTISVHTDSKSHRKSYTYYIHLTSWVSKKTFSKSVSKGEYDSYRAGDVFEVITREGYFGYPYYEKLYRTSDRSLFPDGIKYPITEEEFQKIREEVKQAELEKEKEKNKYRYYR